MVALSKVQFIIKNTSLLINTHTPFVSGNVTLGCSSSRASMFAHPQVNNTLL